MFPFSFWPTYIYNVLLDGYQPCILLLGRSGVVCPWFHWSLSRLCMGEITWDPLPIDHQVSSCRLVDFISYSLVAPKQVLKQKGGVSCSLHKTGLLFDQCGCVQCVPIYIMCSWVGISLVLCLRGGLEWFAPGSIEVYHGSVWRKSPWTPRPLITKSIHVGWLTSFLIAWSHRNMSETWSLAISYFSFIPVLHVLSSLRPMRFGMVSEQCGGHSKATTKFYWVRSEGVDRFVVDWCWVDGFAGFSSFLKLGCACPVPAYLLECQQNQEAWQLIIMPHPHLWNVGSVFVFVSLFVRGHAADMQGPNLNGMKSCKPGSGRVQ